MPSTLSRRAVWYLGIFTVPENRPQPAYLPTGSPMNRVMVRGKLAGYPTGLCPLLTSWIASGRYTAWGCRRCHRPASCRSPRVGSGEPTVASLCPAGRGARQFRQVQKKIPDYDLSCQEQSNGRGLNLPRGQEVPNCCHFVLGRVTKFSRSACVVNRQRGRISDRRET